MPISVLLVDDSLTFLRATTQFLEAHDDIIVVGTAADGEEALTLAEKLRPQVILTDLAMPCLPGLQAIPRLRAMLPEAGIIALTVMNTNSFQQAALAAGADVFIPKASMRTDLIPSIRQLAGTGREERVEPEEFHPKTGDGASGPRRVLIMEDNAQLLRLFNKALRTSGYDVHAAETIQEARDMLTQVRFDVLLCDIHMGEDRGTDLLREYAEKFATDGTQVVVVSGQAQYRNICEEMGADFFLEKPVAVGTLVALVDRLTARQSFADE
jgi:CheY-like chemotaxis protein